jgi:hypothetical protein
MGHFVFLANRPLARGWILFEIAFRLFSIMTEFGMSFVELLRYLTCMVGSDGAADLSSYKFRSRRTFQEYSLEHVIKISFPQIIICDGITDLQADLYDYCGKETFSNMKTHTPEDKKMLQERLELLIGSAANVNQIINQLSMGARIQVFYSICSRILAQADGLPQLLQGSNDPLDQEQARLFRFANVSDPANLEIRSPQISQICCISQVEHEDGSHILRFAPFPLEEWIAHHHGSRRDTEEARSELGKGAFAVTLRMTTPDGRLPVAVKRYIRRDLRVLGLKEEDVMQEAATLSTLHHRHVIRYLGVVRTEQYLLLAMELAPGGSLAKVVQQGVAVAEAVRLAGQLAGAVAYLHDRGVIHRDLKPDNVLLSDAGDVKAPPPPLPPPPRRLAAPGAGERGRLWGWGRGGVGRHLGQGAG